MLIDGNKLPAERRYPANNMALSSKFRPGDRGEGDRTIQSVLGYEFANIVSQVCVAVDASHKYSNDLPPACFSKVEVRDIVATNVTRDTRLGDGHCDVINVRGSMDPARPVDVEISDVAMIDIGTGVMSVFLNEGHFDEVVVRNVSSVRGQSWQWTTRGGGSMRSVLISNCPGEKLILSGAPGSIGEIVVVDSPGFVVTEEQSPEGRPGAKVTYVTSSPAPLPENAVADAIDARLAAMDRKIVDLAFAGGRDVKWLSEELKALTVENAKLRSQVTSIQKQLASVVKKLEAKK